MFSICFLFLVSPFYVYFFIFCGLTHHPPPATRHPLPATRLPATRHPSPVTRGRVLPELNSFFMKTLSFVPIKLHRCWPRDCKRSTLAFSIMSTMHGHSNDHVFNGPRACSLKTVDRDLTLPGVSPM